MSLVRFRSKALGYDNCSYSPAFHEFQKTLKSACNLGKPVIRYEMSERQQFNMREWLSWWSTTLPRSGSRVRVPSRALKSTRKGIRNGYPFLCCSSPAGLECSRSPLRSGRCKANVHWTFCNVSRSSEKCAEAFIYKGFGIFLYKANSLICCLHKIMREH